MRIKSAGIIPAVEDIDTIIARYPCWFDEAINTAEAALMLDTTAAALNQARQRGMGPDFIVDGTRIKYTRRSVIDYLRERQVKSVA